MMERDSRHPAFALAELYGTKDHEGTMLALRPGEWVDVKARLKPRYSPTESITTNLLGGFWLRKNTLTPHPGGGFV
jgi:hypothetical protein